VSLTISVLLHLRKNIDMKTHSFLSLSVCADL
jgi:hypothetical protein